MALGDAFGPGVQELHDSLLSQYQPDDGQPYSPDPSTLADRLARKLAVTPSKVEDVDFSPKQPKQNEAKAPDLSSFGEAVPEPSNDDLSSFGEPVKPAAEPQPGVLATVGGAAKTFGKGLLRGAPEQAGSMMQGAAALTHAKPISPEGVGLIDELAGAGDMSASARAKLMGRALRTIGDRGAQMDFNAALQRIARGSNAAAEAQKLRDSFGIQNKKAAAPIEKDTLYKAGKATKEWIDKTVPMTDEEKSSISGAVGTGVSGMLPYLAAGILLGPEAGLVLGAAGMGASTAGSTFEQAKAKGATDEKAATAAGWGAGIGAALGTLPLAMVFKPVSAASNTWKSWFAAKLVQAGQSGVTFATVGEAQEFLLQQVAKEQYDPQAGYSPDAKRMISSFLTGGVLGTIHPLTPKPSDLSSPEAIADFLRRASATGRTPEEEAAHQRGAQTRSEIDDFIHEKDAREAAGAPRLPGPQGGGEGPAEGPPGGEPETPKGTTGGAPTEQTEIEALKRYGWSDEEIASMTPAQRRAEFQDAMATGESQPSTSLNPNERGSSETPPSTSEAPAATRDEPIKATTQKDVLDAQPAEPKSQAQAEAENYQHAHVELEHLGLTGRNSISIETGVGGVRKGPVGEDGKPEWQVTMPVAYGRIKGTKGTDGQPLDIFIGPVPTSQHVFVIDQHHNEGGFDEHKIMAGFPGPDAALRAYADSYEDKGGDRIGHVTAMTPDQFREWIKGDTTQPLKKTLSEEEIGNLFDDLVSGGEHTGQKGGEPVTKSEEVGPPQLPQEPSDGGPSPVPAGAVDNGKVKSKDGEVIAPGKVYAEPTEQHHAQIEAVLGADYHHVLPVDASRAAEILAENPGISPQLAFQHAVIENALTQKFLTHQQLEQAYGPEVKALLESGGEGSHLGGEPVEQGGTTSEQEPTSGGEKTGVVSGGGETGPREPAKGAVDQTGDHHQLDDTGGEQPNTKRKTGGAADEEGAGSTEDAGRVESYDLDGATADIQAADSDETVKVTLTRKGPWDFNDTWPAPDPDVLKAQAKEGRNPFADGFDVENVVGMLDEGMNNITSALAEVREIDRRMADIRSGKTKLKRKQTVDDALNPLIADRKRYGQEAVDTAASYEDVFGREAARAMMIEARRRLVKEERQNPEARAKPEATEAVDDAIWWDGLESWDKDRLAQLSTLGSGFKSAVPWSKIKPEARAKIIAAKPAFQKEQAKKAATLAEVEVERAKIEAEVAEFTKRREGESDATFFDRLIDAYYGWDGGERWDGVKSAIGSGAIQKALEPLTTSEVLKPTLPKGSKVKDVSFNVMKTPVGYTAGSQWSIDGWMGHYGHASIWPDIVNDKNERGYFPTREAALRKDVTRTIESLERVRDLVHDSAGTDAKRKSAGIVADFLKKWLDEVAPPPAEKQKIEDVGEKIGGARKDQWADKGITVGDLADMSDADKTKSITKENVWPRPDYKAAVEDGVDPQAAAAIKLLYDKLPTKPLDTYDHLDYRAHYVEVLNAAREVLSKVKTMADLRDAGDKIEKALGSSSYSKLGSIALRNRSPFYIGGMLVRRAERMVAEGFPNLEPWQRLFTISDIPVYEGNKHTGKNKFSVYRKNGGSQGVFDTREAAEAAAKKAYDALSEERKKGGEEPTRPHLDNIERSGPDYRKGKNVTGEDFIKDFGFRGVEFGNWVANDERQRTVNFAYDGLHDLARVLGVDPKAISLNGTLGLAFGARGRGGRAAAHYESHTLAINMTKLQGSGTLAHEWGHALDDYLAMAHGARPGFGLTGWRVTPRNPDSHWKGGKFNGENKQFPAKLRVAANKLMHDLFNVEETDDQAIARIEDKIKQRKSGQAGWVERINYLREAVRKGGSAAGLKKAERQAGIWNDLLKGLEKQLAEGIYRHSIPSSYLRQAQKLSGPSGDYWRRPNEMFARAFEAYVFDKIAEEGFSSQYLVQGVEPDRYGAGFNGNPYPVGKERETINSDFDRLLRALEATEGKHGIASRLVGSKAEPEPIAESTKVLKPQPQPSPKEEHEAVDQASKPATLDQAFYEHFVSGKGFDGILQARKFAHEAGFAGDPKSTEEALEFGVVKAARWLIEADAEPAHTYDALVKLYGKQPRLGTRTSTSVRDQAYSTPVPLGYLAQKLAGITDKTTVFEPTAGNGALLTVADPKNTFANEINPDRAENLREQGFDVTTKDAATGFTNVKPTVDRVIANPPFGPVKENGESKVFDLSSIQPGYKTTEIDHVIALRSLEAMKDDGRAVLILGGLNKQVATPEGRSNGYNGKSKREFYLTLYNNYNVTDHFTVNGDLYERQGAGWPVDVIVINGRGKSARALPAVDVPRIYDTWEALGGLLDGRQNEENAGAVERPNGGAAETGNGLEGGGSDNRGGTRRVGPASGRGQEQPSGVREEPVSGQPETGGAGGAGDQEQGGPVRGGRSAGSGEQPAAERSSSRLSADEIGDIFDELTGEKPVTRPTSEVAKSAAKNAVSAADKAMEGLTQLFGGGKTIGMGLNVDEDTYAKAKPMFIEAAEKFSDFKYDIRELMRRMIDHLKDAYKWTSEHLKNARPYIVRFIQDVQDGTINLHKPAEEPAKPVAQPKTTTKAAETAGQVTYEPQSKIEGLDTLVPVNMKKSIADSLAGLEQKVGPIDDFVAKELGYDKDDLEDYFGAEQVDALGLAIDNLNKGKGFIIGDQTGIGKGRVNAAIIKWAMRKGRIPVFTTMMPDLYADMVRDMTDIGMDVPRILATNNGLSMTLDEAGKHWLRTGDSKKHAGLLNSLRDPEEFKKKYDVVFTTYAQMQTLKGENTERRRFLSGIMPSATIIFDESHNAGGQVKERKGNSVVADRSEFARDLVKKANGVFYSSATYAKRPDVMSLYAATDMAMAVDDINLLGEAISRGGIPMQQVVAAMLAKSGQYIRRERSFEGINYNTLIVKVDHETYDQISHGLRAIQDFSLLVRKATEAISDDLKGQAGAVGHDNATSDAGASSTNFTSIMHNVINQMLLAMKVPEAAKMAIQHIRNGEKPGLTVANTMESFLKDYADTLDIKPGDEIDADFADVLIKYLDRSRRITIREPFGKESKHHVLTDAELGPEGLEAYNNAKAMIAQMDLSHLPISPIDHLKAELQKAGYEVGEITGRGLVIDYTGDKPVLRSRPGGETTTKGKNDTRNRFNTRSQKGGSHAIIINQSGSTGVSMHASAKFDDKSKRRMMIVQPEANIDTHMQLLGRVNRTGQVVLPEYDQLVADIPAEKRPASVLAKKMASLNANTTASRTSAVTAKDVPDFMNQYGDQVAVAYLADNPELNERLGWPIKPSEGKLKAEGAMRKLTGRLPLEPHADQETHYQHLEEEYDALIKQVEASGASPLEAKTLDLKARTLETSEVQGPKNNSGSPFAAPVNIEKVSVLRQGKPFKPQEVVQQVAQRLGMEDYYGKSDDIEKLWQDLAHVSNLRKAQKIEQDERNTALRAFNDYSMPHLNKIEDNKELEAERNKLNAIKDRWTSLHTLLPIGARVRLNMFDSNPVAVVLDITQTGKTKNPLALSSWKVHFATADASRQMTLPFSRFYLQGAADSESMLDVEVVPTNETAKDTLARFEMMQSGAREERYIATGNLLAAYDWLNMKGSILNYTDAQGAVHQGIMTPKDFNLGKHAIAKGRIVADPVELKQILDQNQTVWSKDRQVNISRADRWSDNYQIQAEKKKATGGRYYLDPALIGLTGDFSSRGGMMTATVPGRDLAKAITRMQEIGANFTVAAAAPQATKVEQPPEPPEDEPPGGGGATLASRAEASPLTTEAQRLTDQIERHLREIVNRVAGPSAKVEFNSGLIQLGSKSPGYSPDLGQRAAGTYSLGRDLIRLALQPGNAEQMATAAFHESYHHIEARLQNEQERKLMEQETPRLREWIKGKTGLTDKQVDGLAGYEVRAIAFQSYANERGSGKPQPGSGIHIMVRRWFDRLMEALRALGNGLRGLGFKTYKDIFNEAYTGKFATREPNEAIGLDPNSLAAMADLFRRSDAAVTGRIRDVMNATTAADRIKEKVQNLNEGVRRLEDAVQARMEGELPDSKAFYQKKRLFPGKVATEVQDFNKQHLDPLIDTLKERGLTLDQVGDILYAQHAEERNAYIDTINPDANGMGSGMSDEEADSILASHDPRDLDEIAHRIDGIRDFILDTMVRGGLESRGITDAWRAQYEHYVPLGGFAEPREGEEDTFRETGKFNVRGREVKRAFGRGSKADNPLLNILDQAYRTIERAKKNEYLRSLQLALRGLEPDDLKGFVQFDRGKPRREIDPRTGLVRSVDDSSYRFSPKAVAYKVGGHTHYMVFEKQAIAEVLKRMHPDALNGVGNFLLTMQNKLKAMWTHYSPEFLIRHFLFRYPIEGTINSFEQGPSNVPRYMADAIPFLGRASKAIFATNRGAVHPDPEVAQYQRYWSEMRQAGGSMAFRQARDVDLLREHLHKKLSAISGRPLATVMDKHRAAVEAMDTVTNALDNALRLAAYATARRQGKSPEQAAVIARDATVDFQQAGAWKNWIGLWFPFGNVAIQTGARMGSAVGRSKIMRRVFAGTIAAGFLSAMFNYLVGGNDKDGIPFFDKMPEWEKHLNLTVMNPFHHDDKGRPVPIHIPLPYNWAFPFALGQAIATMAFSKIKGAARHMIGMAIKAGLEAFTPFAQEGNLAATLAPELARPVVHAYTNQNWTGYPMHLNPDFQKGPRSESGFKSTGEGWKYSTRMLNAMSGGDKKHSGYIDMFPEDLRELFDYYSGTGTQRRFVTNIATTAQNAVTGKPTDYSKLPLSRVFMGTDYDAADRFRRQENRREQKRPWEH
jgi:hypothetical protein